MPWTLDTRPYCRTGPTLRIFNSTKHRKPPTNKLHVCMLQIPQVNYVPTILCTCILRRRNFLNDILAHKRVRLLHFHNGKQGSCLPSVQFEKKKKTLDFSYKNPSLQGPDIWTFSNQNNRKN